MGTLVVLYVCVWSYRQSFMLQWTTGVSLSWKQHPCFSARWSDKKSIGVHKDIHHHHHHLHPHHHHHHHHHLHPQHTSTEDPECMTGPSRMRICCYHFEGKEYPQHTRTQDPKKLSDPSLNESQMQDCIGSSPHDWVTECNFQICGSLWADGLISKVAPMKSI